MSWFAEPDDVVLAYRALAKTFGTNEKAHDAAVRDAFRQADHLADDIYDVPAALLFALGRTPRSFGAFRAMSALLVAYHAKTLGFRLDATPIELADVVVRVARRELAFEDVRGWMNERLLPFGG